ncbi:DUF4236 domain-containing protein [Pseudomonas sp. LJDD11]|uniref:DUF4236 domain-containing protein n=1 Tax=Pseudomonas sp. LJDD11 TaxID=2931984 RepID=UPI00211CDA61|nr:DUF4236 domain-containing protein [Pseudomonas sp. LJDD11]MCQ9426679.1 DUF4236 domain-containing protein [Pseudomonas sp. LJDD11]
MALRFRKSIKIIPGVKLNLGKKGASLSVGGRGLTANISRRGTRVTAGVPGTGLSTTTMMNSRTQPAESEILFDAAWHRKRLVEVVSTVRSIISWAAGVFFSLTGLGLSSKHLWGGSLVMWGGLLFLPIIKRLINRVSGLNIHGFFYFTAGLVLIFVGAALTA